ncbi:MAG: catechol-2,3-dioxygenase [Acidimicrobiales bacterium]|jgi:catechol-2,3-dioxygenase
MPPTKFAHVVLKTSRYKEMLDWWTTVLEAEIRHGNGTLTFMSYDDEHHRVAIVNMPDLVDRDRKSAGVAHVAFTYASLDELFATYSRLKAKGIEPFWTINHGMTLSGYYRDPDRNEVELQVDICSLEEADQFMRSPVFAANPIGIKVDFDELISRYDAGEAADAITAYVPA